MRKDLENSYDHIVFLVRLLHKSDIEYVIVAILMELGIPAKHEGYHYLKASILNYNSSMIGIVNAKLYQTVAEQYGGTRLSVEKAIRSAIKAGWKNRFRWSRLLRNRCWNVKILHYLIFAVKHRLRMK